jgi:hypothetical protein
MDGWMGAHHLYVYKHKYTPTLTKHAHVRRLRGGQGAGPDGRDGRLRRPPHVPLQRPGAFGIFDRWGGVVGWGSVRVRVGI